VADWLSLVYSKANLLLKHLIREAKLEAGDIERYLAELGAELKNRGLKKPVRVLLIGGAYMLLLASAARSTKDIDIFWLDEDGFQRAYAPLRESVQMITKKHDLDADWLNYLAQMLMFDEVMVPEGMLWKRFGPLTSMRQKSSIFWHSKSRRDARKTWRIVLYY
jgi:hypothetical protein